MVKIFLPSSQRNRRPVIISVISFSVATAHVLYAQTYKFQATISSLDTNNNPYAESNIGLVAGDILTGTIVIDRSSPDTLPGDPSRGVFLNTDPANDTWNSPYIYRSYVTIELPVGTYGFGNKLEYTYGFVRPTLTVVNNSDFQSPSQTFSGDTLQFLNRYTIPEESKNSPSIRGSATRSLNLLLNDPSGIAFDSKALPTDVSLTSFSTATISYQKRAEFGTTYNANGENISPYAGFTAHITSITGVPEPSAFALVTLTGTACLFRRHRRSRLLTKKDF